MLRRGGRASLEECGAGRTHEGDGAPGCELSIGCVGGSSGGSESGGGEMDMDCVSGASGVSGTRRSSIPDVSLSRGGEGTTCGMGGVSSTTTGRALDDPPAPAAQRRRSVDIAAA